MSREIENVSFDGVEPEQGEEVLEEVSTGLTESIKARTSGAYHYTKGHVQRRPQVFVALASAAAVLLVGRWAFRHGIISVRVVRSDAS